MNIRKAAICLFFVLLTVLGLSTDYGVPVDEWSELVILQENMHEYALRLGHDGAAQWYETRDIDRISQSIERDHGMCAYYAFMPLAALWMDAPHLLHAAWQCYTWLWFMAGVIALYGLCRELGMTRPVSCMGSLLLYLCPRFFAEGHYNNKDMVLLSLVLLCLWLGARFLKQPGYRRGLWFSLFGAMAMNTKIVGAFPWGMMGLMAIVLVTARRQWNRQMVGVALATVVSFAAIYALLTPACWADPVGYLEYLLLNASGFTRWTGVVVFDGMVIDQAVQPLPRAYLLKMMLITLPVYVVPLAAVGQLTTLGQVILRRAKALSDPTMLILTAVSLCWFVPLFFAVLTQPKVYNGWRHFYFVYAGVAALAAYGINMLMRFAKAKTGDYGMHRVLAAGLCLCFVWMGCGIAANHPKQYGYYNRLSRENAQTDFELDYWTVSTKGAMEALIGRERDESLPLTLGVRNEMDWIGVSRGYLALSPEEQTALQVVKDRQAPYLLYNSTYALIYGEEPPQGYHELFTLRSYGLTLCTVYERD